MVENRITLATPDGPMDAWEAIPDGTGPHRAVVVVQEAFGVNPHIQDVCRRFAREGFVAIAPELFHRTGRGLSFGYGEFLTSVRPHFIALENEAIEADLAAAMAHLRARSDVAPGAVGVVGFCVGGFAAFLAACRTDVAASVVFYGGAIVEGRPSLRLRPVIDEASGIKAPILCFFGEADQSIPQAQVAVIAARLAALPVAHEVVTYPGADHGFFCDARGTYQARAAEDAWKRTLAWLRAHLRV